MNLAEYKGVYVFAQQVDNEISGIAYELLGKGKELAAKLNEEGRLPAIYFVFSKKDCRRLLNDLSTQSDILTNNDEQNEIKNILKEYHLNY